MDTPNYNRVYVRAVEEGSVVELQAEYIYMTIPSKYMCTYMRLVGLVADIGRQLLDDCNATCKGSGKNITNCWNMFQSALACYSLDRTDEADLLVNYIDKQISNLYNLNNVEFEKVGIFPISEDGTIKAICQCGEDMKIVATPETKAAYEDYLLHKDDGKVYVQTEEETT